MSWNDPGDVVLCALALLFGVCFILSMFFGD